LNGNIIASSTTISPVELSYLDGVTSNIQTQLNSSNIVAIAHYSKNSNQTINRGSTKIQFENQIFYKDTSGLIIKNTNCLLI
jgi:predicted metallo-beta-lactamase superfamily hydrolase